MTSKVAIVHEPSLNYKKEYLFTTDNPVYAAVERLFQRLGMDSGQFGKTAWNPLGDLVSPGQLVVIKPNFVTSRDRELVLEGEYLECSSTHPAVLRPIIDYTWKALEGRGEIWVVDSPLEGSNFQKTTAQLGMLELLAHLREKGEKLELLDIRDFVMVPRMLLDNFRTNNHSVNVGLLMRKALPGDPRGYKVVDLKERSCFAGSFTNQPGLRFHRSNLTTPVPHHTNGRHEYCFSGTVLQADVVINVPKLKTHKKTGATLALKSVIGLTNKKYWLPHYQAGPPPFGDEYPEQLPAGDLIAWRLSRYPLPLGHSLIINVPRVKDRKKLLTEGCWAGNDTLWRTIIDLNRILFYADKNGVMQSVPQRRYLALIDGIVGGEGEGPLRSSPKQSGVLVASQDPVAADMVATRIMGLDVEQVKAITKCRDLSELPIGVADIEKIEVVPAELLSLNFEYRPAPGWEQLSVARQQ